QAEALCDRQQAARLGREVALIGVGAAHDQRELRERGLFGGETVPVDDRVERALGAVVAELGAGVVIWCRTLSFGDFGHLVPRHVQELRIGVDEAFDQPRTGDAVDLWPLTSNPLHTYSFQVAPARATDPSRAT